MNEKSELLIIVDEFAPGVYEVKRLFDTICELEKSMEYHVVLNTEVNKKDLNNADCIMFFRSISVLDYELARICLKHKKRIFMFIDDDFLGLSKSYGIYNVGTWPGREKSLIKMMPMAAAVLSSNIMLAEKYAKIGNVDRIIRTDTPVEGNTLFPCAKPSERCRMLLYINDGSIDMFEKYIHPALRILSDRLPGKMSLDLFALKPDCSDIEGKIEINYTSHMNYPEFKKYIGEKQYDIGLAPLDNDGFNQYKYFNKYIEYTRAGVFGIYSDCPLYQQVIENGVNGSLVDNTPAAWADAIEYYFNNNERRLECVENAQMSVLKEFNKYEIANRIIAGLPELLMHTQSNNEIRDVAIIRARAIYYLSRFNERIYIIYQCYKIGGIGKVFKALGNRLERYRTNKHGN